MTFLDQYNLTQQTPFVGRVEAALVHAAIQVANEVANDIQTITTSGNATGGSFTVTGGPLGTNTATIAFNASAGDVQVTLQAVSGIGYGNVVCSGGPLPSTGITITWCGTLGNQPQSLIKVGTNSLTGTASPSPVFTHTSTGVSYPNHSVRQALASKILANPTGYAQLMSIGVADSGTVQADWPGPGYSATGATVDTDLSNQVSAIFNAYT